MQESGGVDVGQVIDGIVSVLSTYGLKIVGALLIFIVGRMVIGWIRGLLRRGLERSKMDDTLVPFVTKLVHYLLLAILVIFVLGQLGIQTAGLVAVVGAAGLAIGLAMQGTLSNFAAGVMLLIFRPFRVGDFIEAAGTAGAVQEIGVFATTLHSPDNVRIVVSNSAVYGSTIKNFSANDTRRVDMVMGISYNDDIGKAMQVIERVLAADDRVLKDPAPTVAVAELADSSVNFVVRPWCAKGDYWPLRFDLHRKLKEELEAAGCSIPYPQQDVHMFQQTSE